MNIRALKKEYVEGMQITDIWDAAAGEGSSYPQLCE